MNSIITYFKNRLTEKTTHLAIVAFVMGLIAKFTGASAEILSATEEVVSALILLGVAAIPTPKLKKDIAKSALSAGIAAFLLLFLSACGGNGSVLGGYLIDIKNPQAKAGFNEATMIYGKVKNANGDEEYQMKFFNLVNGQESSELKLELALSDGTIYKFSAGEVQAFKAFDTRADVEKAIAETVGGILSPEMIAEVAKKLAAGGISP